MKKFSKIIAAMLTVFMLFGVLTAVFASAAESTGASLDVSGHDANVSWNYDDGEIGKVGSDGWLYANELVDDGKSKYGREFGIMGDTNKYLHISPILGPENVYRDEQNNGKDDGYKNSSATQLNVPQDLTNVAYFTIDFDFGTDRYLYIDDGGVPRTHYDSDGDGKLDTPVTDPAQVPGRECYPAYGYCTANNVKSTATPHNSRNQAFWFMSVFADNDNTALNFASQYIGFDIDTMQFYMFAQEMDGATTNKPATRVYLANEVGVFDHITKAYRITGDAKSGYTIYEYVYVNGVHYWTSVKTAKGSLRFLRERMQTYAEGFRGSSNDRDYNYSWIFDNISFNFYGSDYVSDEGYGIDDFMAEDPTQPIYNCEDVVFHNYKSPNGYLTVDDTTTPFPEEFDGLLAEIKNKSIVEATVDILDFVVPEGVDSFTVSAPKFTLSEESAKDYLAIKNMDGSYLVRRILDSDSVTLNWVYNDGTENILFRTSSLITSKMPDTSELVVPVFDAATNTVTKYTYSDWMIDIDGNFPNINLFDPEPLRALEFDEVSLINEDLGGVLTVYAANCNVGEPIDVSETVPDDIALVKWYAPDGELVSAYSVMAGTAVAPYSLDGLLEPVNSAWYDVDCKWVNTTEQADSENSFVTVGGCVNEFVATASLVADIDAMLNMSYWSHFSINLHLPKEEGIVFLPTNAEGDTGFFSEAGVRITANAGATKVVYNGEALETYFVQDFPSTDSFDDYVKVVKFIVSEYDINGNGTVEDNEKNIPLEQSFRLNDLEYATKVAKSYDCGSEELKLIYAYVNYKYEVYKSITGENDFAERAEELFGAFFAEIEKHGEDCSCVADYTGVNELFDDKEKAITEESYAELVYDSESGTGAVIGVSYVLDVSKPAISIYVAKDVASEPVITVKYLNLVTGEDSTYAIVSAPVEDTVGDIECLRYDLTSIAAENINSVFEITVQIGEDDTYTGSYCLAEYIEKQPNVTLAKVYYAYANACKEYAKVIKEQYDVSDYGVVVDY